MPEEVLTSRSVDLIISLRNPWMPRNEQTEMSFLYVSSVRSVCLPKEWKRLMPGFQRYVSVHLYPFPLPFPKNHVRIAVAVMSLPFQTFGAVYHSIEANRRVELWIGPAGSVGWRSSFPRFRVGGALGLLAMATEKIERNSICTDDRKRNARNQA